MWVAMTQEEVKNVVVGQRIKVNGTETKVTGLYNREKGDYGFDVDKKVISESPAWGECFLAGVVSSSGIESEHNIFERWSDEG
jgi:hypothetical protein